MVDVVKGSVDGRGLRVVVICARFNEEVTERLLKGAVDGLTESGVAPEDVQVLSVAGAVEIPLAAQGAIRAGSPDAVVALGAVIRGETSHYDYVCSMCADGCLKVSLDTSVPISFGVLTCENRAQALARCAPGKNKGQEAAHVALEMVSLLRKISQ